jgi:hypothetical protein
MSRWAATFALGVVTTTQLSAQELRLRFTQADGVRVHRLFQVHASITQTSDAGTRGGEVAYMGGMSQLATLGAGGVVLHLSFDSLTVLSRPDGGEWHQAPAANAETQWTQARFDERLHLAHAVPSEGWQTELLTTLVTGAPGLELPAGSVRARSRWRAEARVDVGNPSTGSDDAPAPPPLRVPMTVSVDSIVVRTPDTLAYLSLAGALTRAVRTIEGTSVRYEATVDGSVVWSSSWRNIVSAAVRTRMFATPQDTQRSGRGSAGLVVERTIRASVRP